MTQERCGGGGRWSWPQVVALIAALAVVVWGIGYVLSEPARTRLLLSTPPSLLLLLVGLVLLPWLANALQLRVVLVLFQTRLSVTEAFLLVVLNNWLNYLPAKGGFVAKGAYLRLRHALAVGDYLSVSMALNLLTASVLMLVGAAAGAYLWLMGRHGPATGFWTVVLIATAVAIPMAVFVTARFADRFTGNSGWRQGIAKVVRGMALWRDCPMVLVRSLGWGVVAFAARTVRLWLALAFVGATITGAEAVLIQAIILIAFLLSITPGNLGVREGLIVVAAAAVGVPTEAAVMGGLLDRAVMMATVFAAGPLGVAYLPRIAGR